MELPAIKLPQIDLPFDIPVLLHPPVDHFIIALPVIVLLLEMINLILKKRAIGITSFFFLILTIIVAIAAYLTGSIDGKEAFPLLNESAQGELKAHKLLGTYLMLSAAVVLIFKILSVMISRGLMKALYLLILILFVAGILKQGKDGGELVYKYGVNVEKVQELDSELDDLKEELEELEEANKPEKSEEKEASTPASTEIQKKVIETSAETVNASVEALKEKAAEVKEKVKTSTEKTEPAVEVVPAAETTQPEIATH